MLSMERAGTLSEELLKPATAPELWTKSCPHWELGHYISPLDWWVGALSHAGVEAARAEAHGGKCPMSCAAPAAHSLCRTLVISDHSHRIQVDFNPSPLSTLSRSMCCTPGRLPAVNIL